MRCTALLVAALLLLCAAATAAAAPAAPAPIDDEYFAHEGVTYRQLLDTETDRYYFQNLGDQSVSWTDPRTQRVRAYRRPDTPADLWRTRVVVALPVGAFAVALALRIVYLRKYYPEALHPTLKRKDRKKGWGRSRYRPPGGNRMSQDGKGGRSANS